MNSGNRQHLLIVAGQLFGSHRFTYSIARKTSAEIVRARVEYVEFLIDCLMKSILQDAEGKLACCRRGSGRFEIVVKELFDSVKFLDKCKQIQREFNDWLLAQHKGSMYLCLLVQQAYEADLNRSGSTWQKIQSMLRQKQLEPFKENLLDIFSEESLQLDECPYCLREDLPLAEIEGAGTSCSACLSCKALVNLSRANVLADSDLQFIPEIGRDIVKRNAKSASSPFRFQTIHTESPHQTVMHISFREDSEKQTSLIENETVPLPAQLLLSELEKLKSFCHTQQERLPLVLEANWDNIILLGSLPVLLELAFSLSEVIDKKLSGVCHATGIVQALNAVPLSWLIRDAVQLSRKVQEQNSPRGLAVNFCADNGAAVSGFSWSDWRNRIRPLLDKIRRFDRMNVLGFGFWDYLFDFSRSDSMSIYPLMYRLARREETHGVLRRDPSWHKFKSELLVALSGSSEDVRQKRQILRTALAWFLFIKRVSPGKQESYELLTVERS